MPAMPPPLSPCGRTSDAAKRSSDASEVTNASVSAPSVSQVAPTTSSPSRSPITSNSSERTGHSGRADLDHALPGAQGQPGRARVGLPAAGPGRRPSPPAASGTSSAADMPPRSDTVPACSGSTGSGSTSVLNARPALVTSSTRPRAVECDDRAYRVVLDPAVAPAPLGRLLRLGRGPGDQPGRGEDHLARVVGDLQRAGRRGGGEHLLEVAVDRAWCAAARRTA